MVLSELYADIMKLMVKKEPYCKKDFSLQKLSKIMCSNTSYVSRAINECAGKSFPNWLAEFRINKATKILDENPSISTSVLCEKIGEKNPVVMRRQFFAVTGVHISEYRNREK